MRLIVLIAIAGLGACADFPEIDGTIDAAARNADFPTLQPLAPLLVAANQTGTQINPASVVNFDTRIARLRGPVVDAATRARMQRGVAVPAAIR